MLDLAAFSLSNLQELWNRESCRKDTRSLTSTGLQLKTPSHMPNKMARVQLGAGQNASLWEYRKANYYRRMEPKELLKWFDNKQYS
jgi:hypothetical protein